MPSKSRSREELDALFGAAMVRRQRWLRDYLEGPPDQSKQFDFLIGSWDTVQSHYDLDGRRVHQATGHWSAQALYDGRMLEDVYESRLPDGGVLAGGRTLRSYCPETERWEMTFLTPLQPNGLTKFVGWERDGEIHCEAEATDTDGVELSARIRFYDIGTDRFEWEQRLSWDQGHSWYRVLSISARRREADPGSG